MAEKSRQFQAIEPKLIAGRTGTNPEQAVKPTANKATRAADAETKRQKIASKSGQSLEKSVAEVTAPEKSSKVNKSIDKALADKQMAAEFANDKEFQATEQYIAQRHAERLAANNIETNNAKMFKTTQGVTLPKGNPLDKGQEKALKGHQRTFESTSNPDARESSRRAIGRILQTGVPAFSSYSQLACQTPGCKNSATLDDDVVCKDCGNAGDPAGVNYRDVPSTSKSKNVAKR